MANILLPTRYIIVTTVVTTDLTLPCPDRDLAVLQQQFSLHSHVGETAAGPDQAVDRAEVES